MSTSAMAIETPEDVYVSLMAKRRGHPIEDTLARILASWSLGKGAMPEWLGLGMPRFRQMMEIHFPGYDPEQFQNTGKAIDAHRSDEMEDLRKLLIENRSTASESEAWMAEIVIAGCLGDDHLWQDLGLWQRSDLSKLMLDNFQVLAERNNKDMKWKKFLYKQLCETEGIFTCRAPSCEICTDYDNCFGPEE